MLLAPHAAGMCWDLRHGPFPLVWSQKTWIEHLFQLGWREGLKLVSVTIIISIPSWHKQNHLHYWMNELSSAFRHSTRRFFQLSRFLSLISLYPRPTKLEGGYTGYTPRPTKLEGGYTGFTLSVCPSVRPSVCRRHGFRSISQVCFGISISNFICMLMVAVGRSLLIFSDVTFKMAAWRPYWIFWFPDCNFTSALNINFKLQRHNTYVYG